MKAKDPFQSGVEYHAISKISPSQLKFTAVSPIPEILYPQREQTGAVSPEASSSKRTVSQQLQNSLPLDTSDLIDRAQTKLHDNEDKTENEKYIIHIRENYYI